MVDFYPILAGSELAPGGAEEVGNKAWNLMLMADAGLPVPPAFVLPTQWCGQEPAVRRAALQNALAAGIERLEAATGLGFGSGHRPLLLSVRSGAALSMPGMMETILDVGLNEQTVTALIRLTGNPRLAWDSYRRLVQFYAEIVANLPTAPFDALIVEALAQDEVDSDVELDYLALRRVTKALLAQYQLMTGTEFPTDPKTQLFAATEAVFGSWSSPKAANYRRLNKLGDAGGTAVTVQTMVFGNEGGLSGAGVGFTRNPATGAREFYFDFQFNAQGEDVVSGRQGLRDHDRLRRVLPAVWMQLTALCRRLETLNHDAQDFEFTVQAGILYLLQTRAAKRTDWAALAIAVDMVGEGLLTPAEGLARIAPIALDKLVRSSFAPPVPPTLAIAEVAGIGVAVGSIALDLDAAKRILAEGKRVILIRRQTVTGDFESMALADGILTATGGRTSHAAVVARQLDKVCLVACPGLTIDLDHRQCRIGDRLLDEGDALSLDGNSGAVHAGSLTMVTERPERALAIVAGWRQESPSVAVIS